MHKVNISPHIKQNKKGIGSVCTEFLHVKHNKVLKYKCNNVVCVMIVEVTSTDMSETL